MSDNDKELQITEKELLAALEDPNFLKKHTTPDSYFLVGLSDVEMIDAVLAAAENDKKE